MRGYLDTIFFGSEQGVICPPLIMKDMALSGMQLNIYFILLIH